MTLHVGETTNFTKRSSEFLTLFYILHSVYIHSQSKVHKYSIDVTAQNTKIGD